MRARACHAPARLGGACCRLGSACRSSRSRARCRWCAPACRPCWYAGCRTHARPERAPITGPVRRFLPRGERLAAASPAVDPTREPACGELLLGLLAAIAQATTVPGALSKAEPVGPHRAGGVGGIEQVIELLAVVDRGAGHAIAPNQLVPPVYAHVIMEWPAPFPRHRI